MVRRKQYDIARCVREAEGEDFGHKRADLARREIYHGCDLFADQSFGVVMRRDLRGGFLHADLCAEVDLHFKSGFARFGEGLRFDDRACTNVDFHEVVKGDFGCCFHGRSLPKFSPRHKPHRRSRAALAISPDLA